MEKIVTYHMVTRMIPKDLTCMSECNLPDNDKVIIQTSAVQSATTVFDLANFRITLNLTPSTVGEQTLLVIMIQETLLRLSKINTTNAI